MSTPEEIAQVLEDAADALWIYGRCTGKAAKDDGSMCVRAALNYAQGMDPRQVFCANTPALLHLEHWLAEHPEVLGEVGLGGWQADILGRRRVPAWAWNDQHLPDWDAVVLDGLRHCAKDLRNEATA